MAFRTTGAPAAIRPAAARRSEKSRGVPPALDISIYEDLGALESEWRRFERVADCTAFQTFDWLSTWHRNVGQRESVLPAIVVGRYGDGAIAFMLPLCVAPERLARRPISASPSAIATITCSQASPSIRRRITDRARCICAN